MCLAEQDEMNQQLQLELAEARGESGPDSGPASARLGEEQGTPQQVTPQQATPQPPTPSNGDATPLTASFLKVDTASIVPEDLFMKSAGADSAVPSSLWSS
eukprot:scaffold5165_cov49-Phaeocystis_antarctica.AAC.2